ncbi:hypothetical protein ABC347_00865 [Sphingomonas sp. 1P06PA]|uniref:hypothetical protein n=1 Tax=Sphingomonas sp. 1P06PA TaxID=554121 RepID=UPI0039A43CCE
MANYWHNIGKPEAPATWATLWQSLRDNSVVTAGFGNQSGGRGHVIVTRYQPGDRVFAYANGFGLIGYGEAIGPHTATLRDTARNGSNHRHEASIIWTASLELDEAISPLAIMQAAEVRHPRQTSERVPNAAADELRSVVDDQIGLR